MEKGAEASNSTRQALDHIDVDHNFQIQDVVARERDADRQIAVADEVFLLDARNADDLDVRARDVRNVAEFVLTNALRAHDFAIQEHAEAQWQHVLQVDTATDERTSTRAIKARHL